MEDEDVKLMPIVSREFRLSISGALAFITAMAWNKFVESIIDKHPSWKDSRLIYAICATFVSITWIIIFNPNFWKAIVNYFKSHM